MNPVPAPVPLTPNRCRCLQDRAERAEWAPLPNIAYKAVALPSLVQAYLLGGALLLARAADGTGACGGADATAAAVLGVVAGPFLAILSAMLIVAAFIAAGLALDFATLVALPCAKAALAALRGRVAPVGSGGGGDAESVAESV